ncbi:MAG: 23S rRNA (adenine(2503)-C(2))-methyltransferase RlmN [Acidobacteria bacterium]|nr:23S rRNA (adenine(2503)-C(2))-methyltransferase RlmN [Acidobacteriota bacterium]MBI3655061.1 23S rRNA (adenine(2503)-C(2))-methyltransferase RlmN [Acidobacteriota bacterium]
MEEKTNLLGLSLTELETAVIGLGERPFRARQIYRSIYRRRQFEIGEMTDLAKDFKQRLTSQFTVAPPQVARVFQSHDGTRRYLLTLTDGQAIESVYIPEARRRTICISTQVGCAMGCTFCVTATMGLVRHLQAGEIVGQVLMILNDVGETRDGSTRLNVVLMGMGEPLHNYDQTVKALALMADVRGMNISPKRITLSTSGVVPALKKLAEEPVVPNLAISLNASSNAQRAALMPINHRWNLQELLQTCRDFPLPPGRRITFEYVLIAGVNDTIADAHRLTKLLGGQRVKVNLIPLNWDPRLNGVATPAGDRILAFQRVLADHHLTAMIRRPRGLDISAACGQLVARQQEH